MSGFGWRRATRAPARPRSPNSSTDGCSSAVEAYGKNLVLRFEGGVVLRSHLRMSGRWRVVPRGSTVGQPWLVLAGTRQEAVLWGGPVLELHTRALERLGPDILAEPLDRDGILARLRAADGRQPLGEALQDQSIVAGIGNMWMAESLWELRPRPGSPLERGERGGSRACPRDAPHA